ncbi:MAG: DEAD/DEAH box helicase [Bacteroidales bacterium]|nr:DEAD/DEAH box helicase [Bacteroidales bacterium]MCF8458232.1 DEAD/DEAH box helicase [Bacteroidales bacterium]
MTFSKINHEEILNNLGFELMNEMQKATLEASANHENLILLAPTGSGKTLAYLLSLLPKINDKPGVQVLILAPTRELVLQIESVLKLMKLPLKVNASYGGHPFSVERKNFSEPPAILAGTPGRIQDHLQRNTFDPNTISQVVFDEFDKSLEFGFSTQMEYIVGQLTNVKSQILVSATQNIEIPGYLKLQKPHTIDFSEEEKGELRLRQIVVPKDEKPEGLLRVLSSMKKGENAIVFVNHREACDRISEYLTICKAAYSIFHGGLKQEQRELELTKFRNGSSSVLISTDIAARGIDIPDLDYVIHYQLPPQENVFLHRNGRTARMKALGTSILIRTTLDPLPSYLKDEPEIFELKEGQPMAQPDWVTFYIGKGKKDKVNKIDLVGFFLQFDFMSKEDLGLIEIKDFSAYVAIRGNKSKALLNAVQNTKIKNKTTRIELAR